MFCTWGLEREFVLNRERKDERIDRMFCFEYQERKDERIDRMICFEYQERKDERIDRIGYGV